MPLSPSLSLFCAYAFFRASVGIYPYAFSLSALAIYILYFSFAIDNFSRIFAGEFVHLFVRSFFHTTEFLRGLYSAKKTEREIAAVEFIVVRWGVRMGRSNDCGSCGNWE